MSETPNRRGGIEMTDYQEEQKRSPEERKNNLSNIFSNILYFLMLAFVIFLYFVSLQPIGPDVRHSNIISDLRSIKGAALMFHTDSRDFIPEIPEGSNACEYLMRYMDNPDKFNNKSLYIFIINGDYWWAGYNMEQIRNKPEFVKGKLAEKASIVGLFGSSQLEPPLSADQVYQYKKSDAYVWMVVQKDEGGAE